MINDHGYDDDDDDKKCLPGDERGVPWCHSWCASTHWMGRKVDLDDYEEVIMMMMRMMFEMLDTM